MPLACTTRTLDTLTTERLEFFADIPHGCKTRVLVPRQGIPMRLHEFFDVRYRPQRLLGKSESTVRLYRYSIRSFSATVKTEPTLDHLTDQGVIDHMQRILSDGRSPATANKDRAQLLAIWRHAFRLGLVDRWPSVPQLREPERTPHAWLPEELSSLFATISKLDGNYGSVPQSLWWQALVMFGLDTAERVNAIRQAKWSWFSGEWVNVPAEARKGKRSDKAYRLSPETLGLMLRVRQLSPSTVFPWPYCDMYIWTVFRKILRSAGLPSGRRDQFHKLRRTCASAVFAAGLDPQEALDHANRRTTKRYLDPRFSRDRQPCDVLAEFLANPKKPRGGRKAV